MRKVFNTDGYCDPELHYMVDLFGRLNEIRVMVDAGQYFTVNRARQYGKTTILTVWIFRRLVMLILHPSRISSLLFRGNCWKTQPIFLQK